uniref:Uncharacterized protein n=1 Tax=Octactis speculum TaxID=3111310 RepID=A0A7S2AUW5_9STRA
MAPYALETSVKLQGQVFLEFSHAYSSQEPIQGSALLRHAGPLSLNMILRSNATREMFASFDECLLAHLELQNLRGVLESGLLPKAGLRGSEGRGQGQGGFECVSK